MGQMSAVIHSVTELTGRHNAAERVVYETHDRRLMTLELLDEFVQQAYYLSAFYLLTCRSALARRKDIFGLSVRRSMCQPRFRHSARERRVPRPRRAKRIPREAQATQIFNHQRKRKSSFRDPRERVNEYVLRIRVPAHGMCGDQSHSRC